MIDKEGMTKHIEKMRAMINKKAGIKAAFNLSEENPTEIIDWIPTGCHLLDSICCAGKIAGIPVGRISELAGDTSSGKSYLALQIALNALKKGIFPVYFDSESSIDPDFIERMGGSLDDFLYVQATSVEFVMETIEEMMGESNKPMLFILDSLAMTPTARALKGSFDPLESMAEKARILSLSFQKLTVPLANHGSTLLIVNQLKTNITNNMAEKLTDPFFTPGGKAASYAYSLRIWLTLRKAKASYVLDENEEIIGTEIKAFIKKSKLGSMGRQVHFKILWAGPKISVQEEEMWLEVIRSSKDLLTSGSWYTMKYLDGTEEKFQAKNFLDKLQGERFRTRVLELLDDVLVKRIRAHEDESKD